MKNSQGSSGFPREVKGKIPKEGFPRKGRVAKGRDLGKGGIPKGSKEFLRK